MSDLIDAAESALREMKFARFVRNCLSGVRLIHESDEETFRRIISLAGKLICRPCRGYGHTFCDSVCPACAGSGNIVDQLSGVSNGSTNVSAKDG